MLVLVITWNNKLTLAALISSNSILQTQESKIHLKAGEKRVVPEYIHTSPLHSPWSSSPPERRKLLQKELSHNPPSPPGFPNLAPKISLLRNFQTLGTPPRNITISDQSEKYTKLLSWATNFATFKYFLVNYLILWHTNRHKLKHIQ